MDFSNAPTQQGGNGEPIPAGTLAWAWLVLRPFNLDQGMFETPSKSTEGNAYLDVELTITEGQYERRKVWDMIGVAGSEKYVEAGHAAIRHILEVAKAAGPQNPAGYQINNFGEIDQMKVAVKITIEKNTGYEDKNRVRYLSPNPASDTCADFKRLLAGDTAPKTAASAVPAAQPAANAWGSPATAAAAAPATPAQQTVTTGPVAPATGTAKPSWM
jgi:hypothetical protein